MMKVAFNYPVRKSVGRSVFLTGMLLAWCLQTGYGQGFRLLGIPLDTLLVTTPPRVDRAYITTYYRRCHVYIVSDRQAYSMHLAGLPHALHYKPNLAWALGVGIDYKWLGTELTIKLPFWGYDPVRQGKTKPFGATININNRRFWFSTQYQFYRSFYIQNPDALESDWLARHSAYPYRSDLRSQTLAGHVLYLFNPLRVSIPASLMQRESQRQTAGSWVVGGFLTYQHLRADSSLVPIALRSNFSPESDFQRFNSLALGADVGYIQTFVFGKHYFANVTVRPGLSVLWQQSKNSSRPELNHISPGWQATTSLTVGYSSDVYYGGLYASATLINQAFANGIVNTDAEYIRLVVGKRIRYQPKGVIRQLPGFK